MALRDVTPRRPSVRGSAPEPIPPEGLDARVEAAHGVPAAADDARSALGGRARAHRLLGGAFAAAMLLASARAAHADDTLFLPLAVHGRPVPAPATPTARPGPVNECADPDPDWVFCDSFEENAPWDGSVEIPPVVEEPGPFDRTGNHVARLRVPAGPGGIGLWKELPPGDRLYARWYVQWEPGHDISARHHGPGGMGADTAWYTGRSGIRPDGDEYFVSTLEPLARAPHEVFAYTYHRGMYMDCADPNGRCWGDHYPCYAGPRYCTRPEHLPTVEQVGTETGVWVCLEQMIDAGTPVRDAAAADGVLNFWIDEVEIGPWTDLWWRTVPTLRINFLWLFLYHHDEHHSQEGILLDNVVVSTSRVYCGR